MFPSQGLSVSGGHAEQKQARKALQAHKIVELSLKKSSQVGADAVLHQDNLIERDAIVYFQNGETDVHNRKSLYVFCSMQSEHLHELWQRPNNATWFITVTVLSTLGIENASTATVGPPTVRYILLMGTEGATRVPPMPPMDTKSLANIPPIPLMSAAISATMFRNSMVFISPVQLFHSESSRP